MTVTFNYPDEIYGLEIKINSDGCDIKFGDLKYFYSSGEIDLCFTDLFSAFSKLKTEKPESIIQNEDIITAHYGEYKIIYNKTKKLITQIQSEKYKWNFT
ncbi:MAG: hypothetical protein KBT46_03720 [Ruminococcus sp.]|nr:hypothetical protein [Candidatus Copronaster equi]